MADSQKQLGPGQKALLITGTIALMIATSAAAGAGAILFLISLGLKQHGNYEYYGLSPARWLIPIAAIVGFVVPGILIWKFHKNQWRVSLRTLLIGTTLIAVALGLAVWATK